MKERPILFSGEMVRAILAGRKTQTRRVVRHIPMLGEPLAWCAAAKAQEPGFVHIVGDYKRFCPYGQPGDRLWVRESFVHKQDVPGYLYKADGEEIIVDDGDGCAVCNKDGSIKSPWKPSIHMPRWASRITLEIVSVRVERLRDISEICCEAELGAAPYSLGDSAYDKFRGLWDSINGNSGFGWKENPWVWVIEFKRVEGR